jgi:hypothetical protein
MNNNRKHTVMYSVGLCGIALALAFMVSPNNNNNSAMAQQNTATMTANKPYPMSPSFGTQNQNWTGSITLFSAILDAFKSKIHATLNDATTSAVTALLSSTILLSSQSARGGAGSRNYCFF